MRNQDGMTTTEVLVAGELLGRALDPITAEVFGKGHELANQVGGELSAVFLGDALSEAVEEIAGYGADRVYKIENQNLGEFSADLWAQALVNLCTSTSPKVFLMPHTGRFSQVAPRLAFQLNKALTTDCIDLEIDSESGALVRTKPIYGGNAIAIFIYDEEPQLVTVRRGVFSPLEKGATRSEVIDFPFKAEKADNQIEVIDFIREEAVAFDKADVIVSGGRGIGGKEGFEELEDLAEALRKLFDTVMVGCSRPAVDLGWVPANRQIGLTGVMVSPNIYFAIGISGAMQHLIGMIKSRKIVAVNTDPSSNIFTVADYGVVGDFRKVIPSFKRKLSELSHEKT